MQTTVANRRTGFVLAQHFYYLYTSASSLAQKRASQGVEERNNSKKYSLIRQKIC